MLSENSMQELGTHQIVVQAWASGGKVFSKTVHVSVNKEVTSTCLPAFDPNVNVCAPVNLSETKGTVLVHAAARSSISPVCCCKLLPENRTGQQFIFQYKNC